MLRCRAPLSLALLLPLLACGGGGDHRGRDGASPATDSTAALAARRAPELDDFGDTVPAGIAPARIVSLNPTTTELLFALGAGDRLVGRTHWDTYPDAARDVPDLGDGLRPNVEAVLGARPGLVVLYASADNRAAAVRLRRAGIATVSLKVDRIADFRRAALLLGRATGSEAGARAVVDSVEGTLARVRASTAALPRPTVFWHVWDAPLITIGAGSYLNELVEIAGGRNVFADLSAPSPTVSFEELLRRDPDAVLMGAVRARALGADARWRGLRAVRTGRLLVVDTLLVGRPGVRLGEAAASLARLLHPELGR